MQTFKSNKGSKITDVDKVKITILYVSINSKITFPNSMEKWVSNFGYFSISFEKITFYILRF